MKDCWSKRDYFRQLVGEYRRGEGITNAEVALRLSISPMTLQKYLSPSPTHKPGEAVLKAFGALKGIDYRILMDDPDIAPPGIGDDQWKDLSERKRVLASAMLHDLAQIPEGEEDGYFQLWKQGVALGRARRDAEKKTVKGAQAK